MAEVIIAPVPLWGTRSDRREALIAGLVSALITALYVGIAASFETPTTWLEILSVWASLASVWLARTENIWTVPYGLGAVVVLGWFLLDVGIVAQGWLQFIYYVPVQMACWWAWSRGGYQGGELEVSRMSASGWLLALSLSIALWLGLAGLFDVVYEEPSYVLWDSSIVAASITAQFLMTRKKTESWWWWTIPVNVSSIGLFARTELWAFMVLYMFFLANSTWGWKTWREVEER